MIDIYKPIFLGRDFISWFLLFLSLTNIFVAIGLVFINPPSTCVFLLAFMNMFMAGFCFHSWATNNLFLAQSELIENTLSLCKRLFLERKILIEQVHQLRSKRKRSKRK